MVQVAPEFVDTDNVMETLGFIVGSNRAFENVAQVLTANVANQEQGGIRHEVGNGAKSDVFSSDSDALGGLIGSSAAGTLTIGDKAVAVDLAVDSLIDIRDKINAAAPAGVIATVNAVGPSDFELQIDGTTDFADDNGVLQAMGVLEASTALDAETRFGDILGAGVQAGDTITISGKNRAGDQVAGSFTITSASLKVQNLLNTVEQLFGDDVTASVDSAGRIMVKDEQAGSSSLALTLQASNEGGGSLNLGALTVTTQGIDARSSELQGGQDAVFRINGITLSRATNTVTDAVQGVTLELKEAEVGALVNITVTKDDTTELRQNIEAFVAEFNTAADLINQQFVVDEATQRGGPLSGDATLISLQSRLRTVISSQIGGLSEGFDALVLVGISFNRNGQLTIDDDRLTEALNENLEEVRQLFVAQGEATDDGVEFISTGRKTEAGNYGVSVTTAAAKGAAIGSIELDGGLAEDQTLRIVDKATGLPGVVELKAGDTLDQIVTRINTELASEVAEVRRGSIANTTNGVTPISAGTAFAGIFGAEVQDGDSIRINGTTHGGNNVTSTFVIDDANTKTVGDLLDAVRSTFGGEVSASVDEEGNIVVTDNQVGTSSLTVTLVEQNEGGGGLNFGSLEMEEEGRLALEITASNQDGKLFLEHSGYGSRNGFSLSQSLDQLGLTEGDYGGVDAQGTINGEEADGFGRILTGKIGSEAVEGLSLRVTLTAEEVAATGSDRGQVNLIYGVARKLKDALSFVTDEFDGSLKNRQDAIDDTISDLDGQVASMERRVEQKRLNLVNKFAALEGALSTMQAEGNFLTSQLAGLTSR